MPGQTCCPAGIPRFVTDKFDSANPNPMWTAGTAGDGPGDCGQAAEHADDQLLGKGRPSGFPKGWLAFRVFGENTCRLETGKKPHV